MCNVTPVVLVELSDMLDTAETLLAENIPALLNGVPAAAVRSELDRILGSRVFLHSQRIRRFLQFVVEECLLGRQHRLKEYLIGIEVFNRMEVFDPRVDSIVRVEARRLRSKLEEYYLTEGRENELRIELRKGSYIPLVEHRRSGSSGYTLPAAGRSSVAIGRLATHNGESAELVSGITRRLTHVLIKEGYCRMMAAFDPDAAVQPDYLLEGSIEQHGQDVRIWLQLISLPEGTYLWSDSGPADDIEALALSMNRAVVTSYQDKKHGVRRRPTSQSFDHYLKGRYLWKVFTPENVRISVTFFQKAVERDPSYAAAWAALAEAGVLSCLFGFPPAQIQEAAQRAVELNGNLPEAHVAWGTVLSILQSDWDAGEREFHRALQLDGRDTAAHVAYALQLACRGMLSEAGSELQRALEMDPASLAMNFALGWLKCVARRYDEAIAQHRLVCQLAPDFALAFLGLGWAHLGKGDLANATAFFANARNLLKCQNLLSGCLGHCYARTGNRDDALRLLAQLEGQPAAAIGRAAIHAGFDDQERAFDQLEQACDAHDVALPLRVLNPEFDALRDQPRYIALSERMGLANGKMRCHDLSASAPSR